MSSALYFKRYHMEIALHDLDPVPSLPEGVTWVPWSESLLATHAETKYRSFRDTLDTTIFPSLGHPAGCLDLMRAIRSKADFVPEATWLVVGADGPIGTIQGLRDRLFGAIQNVGVVPEHRGRGFGTALLLKALHGFVRAGLRKAYLDVTARNESAVRLYRRYGFRSTRTIYKAVPTPILVPDDALVMI